MIRFFKIRARSLNQLIGSMLVIAGTTGATAQDRLNIGTEVKLRTLHSYDSNLFLTSDGTSDELTTYAVNFGAALGYNTARLGARVDIADKHYNRYTDQNDTSYDLNTYASLGDAAFRCSLFSQSDHTIAPIDSSFTTRAERDTQRVWATIEATPAYLFGINLSSGYEDRRYIGFNDYEYMQTNASISVYGMYDKRTKIGLKYYRAELDYDEDIRYDADITRETVFVEYDYNGDMRAQVEMGHEIFKFHTPWWSNVDREHAEGFYMATLLTYNPSERLELKANLSRSLLPSHSPSSYFNTKVAAGLGVVYRPVSEVRLEAEIYYIQTDENASFDNDTYGGKLKAAYAVSEWAEVECQYEYDQRDTDAPGDDYVRQIITLGLTLRW